MSDLAIGAVLKNFTSEGYKPVAYKLRMLIKSEQNYPNYNKELFAIVHSPKKWQCFLKGVKHLKILLDHKSLEFLKMQLKLIYCQTG